MKIITSKQAQMLPKVGRGRGNGTKNKVLEALSNLENGQILQVDKEDWKLKGHPGKYAYIYSFLKNKKFQTRTLADNKGWIITRVG